MFTFQDRHKYFGNNSYLWNELNQIIFGLYFDTIVVTCYWLCRICHIVVNPLRKCTHMNNDINNGDVKEKYVNAQGRGGGLNIFWSERVVCAALGRCRENEGASFNINGVFHFFLSAVVTFLP